MRHAITLAIGCAALLLVDQMVGLPHGGWVILTFCLVYLPSVNETRARVRDRVIGTVVGAIVAGAIASQAPRLVCFALALPCALLAVAFALMPDETSATSCF